MNNGGQNRLATSNATLLTDLNNLRNDNIFLSNEVCNFKDVTGINSRKGLDRVILPNFQPNVVIKFIDFFFIYQMISPIFLNVWWVLYKFKVLYGNR